LVEEGDLWRHLPLELGFGGASTCYRRLDEWQRVGVWERLHEQLLAELRAAGETEWARARSPIPATCRRKRGFETRPEPGRSSEIGSKHHLLVDASGIPLA
jgi:transposase